jgi:hypothetical protein
MSTEALFSPPPAAPTGQPAQGSGGYVPRFVDHSTLSPMARHEWQQVMMNPTLERVQAFEAKYSQQNTSGSPDGVGAQSSSGAPESAAPSNSAPPPEEGTASPYDEGFTPEALELFREHGTHPYLVAALEPGYNRFYDRIAALPEAERQTAIDASEAEVVRQVYRDDEHALKAGLGSKKP